MAVRDHVTPWYQEHTIHLMVILKSNKEKLYRFFPFLANTKSQAISFMAYNWTTTRPGKFLLYNT